jgi:PAS domain-containing protein
MISYMNAQEKTEQQAQYLRAVFDAIPLPAFVVDADVRIQDFNTAAGELLGAEPAAALHQRGGEAFHCVNAGPHGCGLGLRCRNCVLRKSVNRAMSGDFVRRELHQTRFRAGQATVSAAMLVTAGLLPYTETPRALLVLEDVTELLQLRRRRRKSR